MEKIVKGILGRAGCMISGSKSGYRESYPENLAVFNANVCVESGKIWYGDLDLTTTRESLKLLAMQLETEIYVLHEMDGRFQHESAPLLKNFVYKVDASGNEFLGEKYTGQYDLESLTRKQA
jgi:hypothetical protein